MPEEVKPRYIYAIPDIHGRADLLQLLIHKLTYYEGMDLDQDKLIFLGDMVDRGPASRQVLEAVRGMARLSPNVVVLAGNHEWLAIDACLKKGYDDIQLWFWNGGRDTVKSFNAENVTYPDMGNDLMPEEVVAWLVSLPLSHREEGFFFSHAPVPNEEDRRPNHRDMPFTKQELIWTYHRDEARFARKFHDGTTGVCGHVHALGQGIMEPRFYDHYIFADAGCGCSTAAPLVAIEVNSRKVIYARPEELTPPAGDAA